ncbi:hypothetical protein [Polymorphospora rubra]|uniref:hypothetical protein n=1 Tax=Polymorphospora rubra TaxID=338584 RepID=UPI0033C90A5F
MADREVTGPAVPDPRQFQVRAARELEQLRALAAGFPLHGLANWTGSRQFSRWHTSDGGLATAGLGHGAYPGPGPYVEVLVNAVDGPDQALERRREVRYATEPPRDEETFRRIDRELLAVEPDEVVIPVEGAPTRFSVWCFPRAGSPRPCSELTAARCRRAGSGRATSNCAGCTTSSPTGTAAGSSRPAADQG